MRNFCLSFFTFFVHQFDFYTKALTLIPPLSSTLNSPHSHIDSLHSYPYSLFEPSNTETRGTIPKEKGHIDLRYKKVVSSLIKSTYTLKSQFQKKCTSKNFRKRNWHHSFISFKSASSYYTQKWTQNSQMVKKHYLNNWWLNDIRYRWKKIINKISCGSSPFFLEHQPMVRITTYDLCYKNALIQLFYMLAQIIEWMNPLMLC